MFDFKKKKEMPDHEKKAKMSVVQSMRDMADEAMGSKLGGLKKISVASDSKSGLEHGLDKAKELAHKAAGGDSLGEYSPADQSEEASESPSMEAGEESGEQDDLAEKFDSMSEEELNKALEALMHAKKF